jgi:hypothetical protein
VGESVGSLSLVLILTGRHLLADGGDVRCLSQLLMLKAIMRRLEYDDGNQIRPCDYFHSITGVGASG